MQLHKEFSLHSWRVIQAAELSWLSSIGSVVQEAPIMSDLQDRIVSEHDRNSGEKGVMKDRQVEDNLQAAEADADVPSKKNSTHDLTANAVKIVGNIKPHQELFHLANPAPTFEQVEETVHSWAVDFLGWRWRRQSRTNSQCVRCPILKAGASPWTIPSVATELTPKEQENDHISPVRPSSWALQSKSVGISIGMGLSASHVTEYRNPKTPLANVMRYFVVIGIFSKAANLPQERIVYFGNPKRLFRHLFWTIIRLRGISGLVSLKGV